MRFAYAFSWFAARFGNAPPNIVNRYLSVLRLRDGATTPGERVAAEAAQARMEVHYPDLPGRVARSMPRAAPSRRPAPPPRRPSPPPPPRQERRYTSYESAHVVFYGETARGGASRKFWRYDQLPERPTHALVSWGRIGTAGQSQTVTLEEARKRLTEKLRKGYQYA